MIVRILSNGKSFKGLAAYLTHDARAKTDERVGWTHTLNCANDDVPGAVNEMVWTARDAELLKQEAGIRTGGRTTENTVKHISLNWSPEESPSREHMIETSEAFLKHMNWQEHQAVLVAHEEKDYSHVHIMLNAIHPETGLKLDDSFERRRAQLWALEYERQQERIYCEQRLKEAAEREDSPTQPAWMAFQKNQQQFENAEKTLFGNNNDNAENQNNPENTHAAEWKRLKEMQRQQREDFFNSGKSAFSELRASIYGEVREEFRERWKSFYAAQKGGADADDLAAMKEALVAEQKARLDARRDEACQDLRDYRDGVYRELLSNQQSMRLELHACHEAGRDSSHVFEADREWETTSEIRTDYRASAETATGRHDSDEREPQMAREPSPERENSTMDSAADTGASLGFGAGWHMLSFAHSVFLEFEGSKTITRRADPSGANPFEQAAEESRKHQQRLDQARDEEEREKRQRERVIGE